jgi:hypothetical protein
MLPNPPSEDCGSSAARSLLSVIWSRYRLLGCVWLMLSRASSRRREPALSLHKRSAFLALANRQRLAQHAPALTRFNPMAPRLFFAASNGGPRPFPPLCPASVFAALSQSLHRGLYIKRVYRRLTLYHTYRRPLSHDTTI